MSSRANFLKTLMAGIAAAPVLATTVTHDHVKAPAMPGKWKEKHWKSGGLSFSEYILPMTMPASFEEARKDRPAHRMIWVPMFDRDVVKTPLKELVANLIDSNTRRTANLKRHNMPVVDEDGNPIDYGSDVLNTQHITIVKVEGYPSLMGISTSEYKLIPIRNYYRDTAERNNRVKHGLGKVEADYSQPANITEKEKAARGEENSSGFKRHTGLRSL